MTKKEMITKMQLLEAAAWLRFQETKTLRGSEDPITNRRRAAWCAVKDVMEEVGVTANPQLPDNLAALTICFNRAAAKREAEAVA
jgi:hypothetical protein